MPHRFIPFFFSAYSGFSLKQTRYLQPKNATTIDFLAAMNPPHVVLYNVTQSKKSSKLHLWSVHTQKHETINVLCRSDIT